MFIQKDNTFVYNNKYIIKIFDFYKVIKLLQSGNSLDLNAIKFI